MKFSFDMDTQSRSRKSKSSKGWSEERILSLGAKLLLSSTIFYILICEAHEIAEKIKAFW